jgi:hypothetical protein
MSRWAFIILCFSFFFIPGCSRGIETSDVIGNYIANHGKGTDILEIRADGTYSHTYKSTLEGEDAAFNYTDNWEFEQDSNRIVLNHYIQGWPWRPGDKVDLIPRNMNTVVKRSFFSGTVKILIDVDSNYYYEKEES